MTVIEMSGVTKEYGDVRALDGMDLSIDQGEIVALLGPNGAGKTTTFELLLDLSRPSRGDVQVLGGPPSAARGRVGAMLQSAGLPEQVTVRELVRVIGRSYPRALPVDEVLDRVNLTGHATRTVTALSGGERQRLLLALALIGEPELLLLDEPTAGMDVVSRRSFWAQAHTAVGHGATILFATHDMTEAETVADRILVIARGRLLADGAPADLVGGDDLEDVFLALTEELSTAHPEGAVR
jgi:ABC-2 type transport system ATP-binding protein